MKFLSRKFFVFVLLTAISTTLKILDKLQDLYYTIIIITIAIVYLFINASLKIKQLEISVEKNKIIVEEDKNEENEEKVF